MRLLANVDVSDSETKRLMIYDSGRNVYLFGYKLLEDSPANWDEWFEDIAEARETGDIKYQVKSNDWQEIPDPLPGCQHDWINPVRRKARGEYPSFEKLENGKWITL